METPSRSHEMGALTTEGAISRREARFLSKKMKHSLKLVVAGLLVAGAATFGARPACAAPSGLGAFPSTDIYGKGTIHYDADTYQSSNFKTGLLTTSGLVYGFGPDSSKALGRTEAGFDYNFGLGGGLTFEKRIFGNIKTQLYNNDDSQIRVVAGGWGLGDSNTNPNYVYLLGSKNFNKIGRFHLGYAYAISDNLFQVNNTPGTGSTTRGRQSVQVGYDRFITPKLQFCADFYSGKGPYAGVQPTLYYYVNDKADFGLGYFRLNDSNAAVRNQLYICFDYNFDFNKGVQSTTAPPAPETNPANPATN
ncbi:hypothetical protein IAD21_00007 [Abditibacteriota bacterium]|nr:hypothetical protein IAD21_00007 [Abditibacteriota bacterium]